jgi:glycerol-3-phosphate O-acyltransferase
VPYAVFEILALQHPKLDLYGLLRLPPDENAIPFETVEKVVIGLKNRLFEMEQQHAIRLAPEIYLPADELIRQGVRKLGVFHSRKPLRFDKAGNIESSDFKVLYYYHNRLSNYRLETVVAASLANQA